MEIQELEKLVKETRSMLSKMEALSLKLKADNDVPAEAFVAQAKTMDFVAKQVYGGK